ncbi:hypothetical protein OG413_20680 [Streptomyces sp. NBC_01433]|uniref:hypothetical protein n=1 Tax=Streptomyces sp. NBC_01433 TaxID=2903864 RepID=UPI00224FA039|nr:hypothetical protein [Streptomyces sp. NBC_01433]MCX4677691.1 hypothetical protein [Streptomyces sp. NBC_01433]
MNNEGGVAVTHAHGTQTPEEGPAGGSFAEQLDFLCKHDPRGPFTNPQVVRMLEEQGLPAFSATYMWQLRNGRADNPTKKHMEGLADFFAVPRDYWSNQATERSMNAVITRLNNFKENGATPDQLHQQLKKITERMSEGVTSEALIGQLEELARLQKAGVTAATLKRLQNSRVTAIAMRAADLSDEGLSAAAAMIEQVRRLEGLPPEHNASSESSPEET